MEMNVTTPAILFPAISLLMLAYTNRFLALATLIRSLHANHEQRKHLASYHGQLANLRKRLRLIRRMQTYGGISFFFCVVSMLCLFFDNEQAGRWTFAKSVRNGIKRAVGVDLYRKFYRHYFGIRAE